MTTGAAKEGDRDLQFLRSPWRSEFVSLLRSARQDLLLVSPYVGAQAIAVLSDELRRGATPAVPQVTFLTDLSIGNMAGGRVDVAGLLGLVEWAHRTEVYHLPSLHAKIYIADTHTAIVTSSNLTLAGMIRNTEYGVRIAAPALVNVIKQDALMYAGLGARITPAALTHFASAAAEISQLRAKVQQSATARLRDALQAKLGLTEQYLLERRAHGETTSRIFGRTLLYVLRHGPMRTQDIHPVVQSIHPDLCDDTIDRVIGGVHFGKKWKHHVRTSQQHLKARGLLVFDGTFWALTPHGRSAADRMASAAGGDSVH